MRIRVNKLPGYEDIENLWYVEDGKLYGKNGVEIKGSWSRSKKYPYSQVTLYTKDGRKIHKRKDRIIAIAFVDGRTKERNEVDHINGVHDDDRPENLRWVSKQENGECRELRKSRAGKR